MDKKYILTLSEREFHDMSSILVMAAVKLPNDTELTPEQKEILGSIKSIAKQIAELEEQE